MVNDDKTLMGFLPDEIRIGHYCSGPGKGGYLRITHLPTGIEVGEELRFDSKEPVRTVKNRLVQQLRKVDKEHGDANEKSKS